MVLLALLSPNLRAASRQAATGGAALRIVVVDGEDAVNIVQQKTAVAPVVEVRERATDCRCNQITGTLTVTRTITNDVGGVSGTGSVVYNVTLR